MGTKIIPPSPRVYVALSGATWLPIELIASSWPLLKFLKHSNECTTMLYYNQPTTLATLCFTPKDVVHLCKQLRSRTACVCSCKWSIITEAPPKTMLFCLFTGKQQHTELPHQNDASNLPRLHPGWPWSESESVCGVFLAAILGREENGRFVWRKKNINFIICNKNNVLLRWGRQKRNREILRKAVKVLAKKQSRVKHFIVSSDTSRKSHQPSWND